MSFDQDGTGGASDTRKGDASRNARRARNCRILGMGGYLPGQVLSNAELAQAFDVTDDWIFSRTGIRERRILEPGRDTSDMAFEAARAALKNAAVPAGEITHILLGSCAPDGLVPNTACTLARKLGLTGLMAMDFNVACSGFLYGLYLARAILLLEPHAKILLVTAEAMSRICNPERRDVRILFGDGAGAAVVAAETGAGPRVEDVLLSADGTHGEILAANGGGSRSAYAAATQPVGEDYFLRMNGREVFKHAVYSMVQICRRILADNGLTVDDVDLFLPHQANARIIDAVGERLGVPEAKTHRYIEYCGNTSGASIPLALEDALRQDRLPSGGRALLASFGAGFTWGAALLRG
ncbi:MAG: beta-ketoacyl-ACP synthase 3 [Desulfovibrio sp.]|nr:beta-ketoacyl-ACP synthase 3 [Desulfovibrio sp.]